MAPGSGLTSSHPAPPLEGNLSGGCVIGVGGKRY